MKERRTGKALGKRAGTDWKRVRSLTDEEIQRGLEADPDVRPTDSKFWKKAKVVLPRNKQTVTIRLDADLLEWLRRERGYQTRVNAVLRMYMEAERGSGPRVSREHANRAIREAYRKRPDSDADDWSTAEKSKR